MFSEAFSAPCRSNFGVSSFQSDSPEPDSVKNQYYLDLTSPPENNPSVITSIRSPASILKYNAVHLLSELCPCVYRNKWHTTPEYFAECHRSFFHRRRLQSFQMDLHCDSHLHNLTINSRGLNDDLVVDNQSQPNDSL